MRSILALVCEIPAVSTSKGSSKQIENGYSSPTPRTDEPRSVSTTMVWGRGKANTLFHCFIWLTGCVVDQGNCICPDENSHRSLHVTSLVLPYPLEAGVWDEPGLTCQFPEVERKATGRQLFARAPSLRISYQDRISFRRNHGRR